MAWEDTRYRAISLWTFPVVFGLICLGRGYCTSFSQTMWSLVINVLILSIQLGGVWLYLILKHQQLINPMKGYLGWGDVLFWLALCPALTPLTFMFFYTSSLVLALLAHFALRRYSFYGNTQKIPLAGLQAICYTGWLLAFGFNDTILWI
ncbi:hypothetical protein [Tunicatimonas pelagia]|uniref:hypothetical protein n=1 Tax=Tunicatimonas pelagia TaxID=931531 RepID=UPI0026652F3D|nr:hypothetical protein [Tunicatimonas pelagia]WKN45347.1 hypothetical protein P0M28_10285 [Tunicatimonas pelagia]